MIKLHHCCLCVAVLVVLAGFASAQNGASIPGTVQPPAGSTGRQTLPAGGNLPGKNFIPMRPSAANQPAPPMERPGGSGAGVVSSQSLTREPYSEQSAGQIPVAEDESILGQFANQRNAEMQQKSQDSMSMMTQTSQMTEAANAGNQQIQSAQQLRDSAGRDMLNQQAEAAASISQAETKRSWNNVLKDAVTTGAIQGGSAFGSAIGKAGADKAINTVFGGSATAQPTQQGTVGGGQSGDETSGEAGGEAAAGAPEDNDEE